MPTDLHYPRRYRLWTTGCDGYDTLGETVGVFGLSSTYQLGDALNSATPIADGSLWLESGASPPYSYMCLHDDDLWVAHIDVADPDPPGGGDQYRTGPFVKRWNGASWDDMGFDLSDYSGNPDNPRRVAIATDFVDTVYLACTSTYTGTDRYVRVFSWTAGVWTELDNYAPTSGIATIGDLDLVARSGSYVVIWEESGGGPFSGTDGFQLDLNATLGAGQFTDLIWDDPSGPQMGWYDPTPTTNASIVDPRDGTLLYDIGEGFGPWFSTVFNGLRYFAFYDSLGDKQTYQIASDMSGSADYLDSEVYYSDTSIWTNNGSQRLMAETNNIWQVGVVNLRTEGDVWPRAGVQFDRRCSTDTPPKRWRLTSYFYPTQTGTVPPTRRHTILQGDTIYALMLRVTPTDEPAEHRVYAMPIQRQCARECEGNGIFQSPFFLDNQEFESGSGSVNWQAKANVAVPYDNVEFSVDGALVATDTSASHEAGSLWHWNYGGGGYNVGALAVGDHDMKVCGYYDDFPAFEVCDTATISVIPVATKFKSLTVRINGNAYTLADILAHNVTAIQTVHIGDNDACVSDRQVDDFRIGTSGYGSTEIFSADFSSGPVPPFDSAVGAGYMTLSGGVLSIDKPDNGDDSYVTRESGVYLSGDNYPELYFQVKVKFDTAEWDSCGGYTGRIITLVKQTGTGTYEAIYVDSSTWQAVNQDISAEGEPTVGVWHTLDIHFSTS